LTYCVVYGTLTTVKKQVLIYQRAEKELLKFPRQVGLKFKTLIEILEIILSAFAKKTQKTPARELVKAQTRYTAYVVTLKGK